MSDGPIIPYLSDQQRASMYGTMFKVVRALDERNVHWWMAYTTLLGAVRHGGVIPWNDTMELQIFDKDVDVLTSIPFGRHELQLQERPNGYVISDGTNDVGITVMTRHYDFVVVETQGRQYNQERYQFNFLFPLIKLKFGPLSLNAPHMPHEWLWRVYGADYMRKDMVKPPKSNPGLFTPYVIKLDRRTAFPLKRKRFLTNRPMPKHNVTYKSPQLD